MKKLLCVLLSILMITSVIVPFQVMADTPSPVLEYTFDDVSEGFSLFGNAKLVNDSDRNSSVLSLDGSSGTYAEIPKGFFDGRSFMTITMDIKSKMREGNFFSFTYGADYNKYSFLRMRGAEALFTTTLTSYNNDKPMSSLSIKPNMWYNVAIVIDGYNNYLYINGVKKGEFISTGVLTSDLGENLRAYFGKSFFDGDLYFNGCFDNFRVYDRALTEEQIIDSVSDTAPLISSVIVGTLADKASTGTDNHTASNTIVNNDKKTITPYVRSSASFSSLPVKISFLSSECTALIDGKKFVNGGKYDLTAARTLTVSYKGRTESYKINPARVAANAVLPGQYGDPDIDYINGKYWMFPTTDGYTWWGGYEFHAFSSTDLVNWKDEGVIINLKDSKPGKNAKGVQIASCDWSDGNAWAPTVEYKNGKCYFYFVGHDARPEGKDRMAIGVATADNPAGPYTVKSTPILTEDIAAQGIDDYPKKGDTIDPAIFTDDDGTSYLLWGNSCAGIAKLNKNMTSVNTSSIAEIKGLYDFLESVYITKRNGVYHFTWSCYGTNNEHYAVKYGTAKSIVPDENGTINVDYHYTLLEKNFDLGLLCTAHQGMLYMKDLDRCFIAYHRFCTPLEEYTEGYGFHRETCIDEVFFDSKGLMKPVTPSMSGTGRVTTKPCSDLRVSLSTTSYTYDGKAKKPSVIAKDLNGKTVSSSNYTVTYSNNVGAGTATATIKFKNSYAGTVTRTFRIVPKVVLSATSFTYDGKVHRPSVTVYDQNGKLNSFSYRLTYSSGLKNVGNYTVKVQLVGKYDDVVTKAFAIIPKGTSISSVTSGSKKFTVKLKKQTTQTTGYQIQYATSSKFTSAKSVTVGNKTTSKTISKLKGKQKYYVRVRTYKTVNGTKIYSTWSKSKTVTTKK